MVPESHIDHVTLVVRDVDASRRFYVGLLGMTEIPRPAFSFDGAWFQAGATLIHLIAEHDRSGPAGYPVEVLVKSSRNHHFAFEVDDSYAAAAALKAKGISLIDDAKLRPDGAVHFFWPTQTIMLSNFVRPRDSEKRSTEGSASCLKNISSP